MEVREKPNILTLAEAMEYCGVKSRATFYRLLKNGQISYVNLNEGGKHEVRRFTQEALDKFLEGGGYRPKG